MHTHNHNNQLTSKNLLLSILLNIVITLSQVIGGVLSGSLSLLSDALHNFSDVISLVISYVASKLTAKHASKNKTFGYKRAEVLAAFINAATLLVVAVLLIIEAIKRFKNPEVIESNLVIILSIVAILGNGFSVLLLKKQSTHNINIKSAYLHLFTDMMASVAVLVGGLLMKFYNLFWVDSFLTLLIALYLLVVGFNLLKISTKMIMLFTPDTIDVNKVVTTINNLPEVKKLHHVHIWNLNDYELHLEAHLDLQKDLTVTQFNSLLITIEKLLHDEFNINHVTIQPEYNKEDSKDIIVQD